MILSRGTDALKASYLKTLFQKVYISDIADRHNLRASEGMGALLNLLASGIGSLINPHKLAKSFTSNGVSGKTISTYIDHLTDASLSTRAERYDVKGKRYIASPYKYSFEDEIGRASCRERV